MKIESKFDGSRGDAPLNLFNDTGRANWFVESNNPMVLMTMPGCYRKITNSAHNNWFKLQAAPARTGEEFFGQLNSIHSEFLSGDICYCEEAPLLIALHRKDCSFERCYDQLEGKPFGSIATSLIFRLLQQSEFREYEISRLIALRDDSRANL